MNLYRELKFYKNNILNNQFFLFLCFIVILMVILLSYFNINNFPNNGLNSYEFGLMYNNLSLFFQGMFYIPISELIILKITAFIYNPEQSLRIKSKNKIWNLITLHIILTSIIISIYIVSLSYILGICFSTVNYTEIHETITLLLILICLSALGMSIYGIIICTLSIISNNKYISYLLVIATLVIEVLSENNSIILSSMSFDLLYINNIIPAILSIFKLLGITIILLEVGRLFFKKHEYMQKQTYL